VWVGIAGDAGYFFAGGVMVKQSPLSLIIKHRLALDVGHRQVTATYYDEALSETHEFVEYFNYANELRPALRKAVERAAKKAAA
jgi:hypothetical protein